MEQAKTHTILLFFLVLSTWYLFSLFATASTSQQSLWSTNYALPRHLHFSLGLSTSPPLLLLRSCQYTPFTIFSSHKQTQTQSFSILLSAYVCVKIIFALQSQFYFQFSIFYFFLFDGVFAITLRGRG